MANAQDWWPRKSPISCGIRFGGALAQVPAGWLADKFDRRWVMIWLSAAAIVSCGLSATITSSDIVVIFGLAGLFGFTTFPIYSVAAAHA